MTFKQSFSGWLSRLLSSIGGQRLSMGSCRQLSGDEDQE